MRLHLMKRCSTILTLCIGAANSAFAGSAIDSMQWATVGSPGNAPYAYDDGEGNPLTVGRVDYEYSILRTEVTAAMWLEFVNAYAPYVAPEYTTNLEFRSTQIGYASDGQGGIVYTLNPARAQLPVEVGWRFAARFANWLHNGKADTRDAFESGAYDAATFVPDHSGPISDQVSRSPGSRFWIPSFDEWTKAAFFDANRYGSGNPGYWSYSNKSDSLPIPGPPGVGETSAGWDFGIALNPPVGAYSYVQSPWGLWDLSGGASEWNESLSLPLWRGVQGTRAEMPAETYWLWETLASQDEDPYWALNGLRIAASIPNTWSALPIISLLVVTKRSRP